MEHFTWEWQIAVTQKDIDKGRPGNPQLCPIARAVRRAVVADELLVSGGIHLYYADQDDPRVLIWSFGDAANTFVVDFDSYGKICKTRVQPATLSFFLDLKR